MLHLAASYKQIVQIVLINGDKMKARTAATKTTVTLDPGTNDDTQVYTLGLTVMGLSACTIGLWAFTSFISGMIASGGPVAMAANWFRAIFGP